MAINKVQFGSNTLMDITDTTTETEDVIEGKVFYAKNGVRSVGSLGDATQSTHGLMSATDKEKLDSITTMTGATSSANGTSGLVPSPTTGDVDKFLAGDGTYKSGGLPMVILSYGKSVWNDFINAYNNHVIVYCRASSNSNPATGAQGRMAFMAYVNNGDNPTEVEFQYYRSMSSHSSSQMGDQVFIYKLSKTGGWSVTVREASIKEISASATGNLSVSYSSNKVTLSGGLPAVTTTDNNKMLKVVNGVWTIVDPNTYSKTETDAAIAQSTANGTWTPTVSGGTATDITVSQGRWYRQGNLVMLTCKWAATAENSGTYAAISGNPFTSVNNPMGCTINQSTGKNGLAFGSGGAATFNLYFAPGQAETANGNAGYAYILFPISA